MHLSLGGRITLAKSVLSATPLYNMSFLPLPKKVANQLRSAHCRFLWGGNSEVRKLAWLKWDVLYRSKKEGGLGLRDFQTFNKALLCKWIWRFIKEKDRLWARVVRSRHGDLKGLRMDERTTSGGGNRTGWWQKIVAVVNGREGRWFWDNLRQKSGDGNDICFWKGLWVGEKPLIKLFPRLFWLSAKKDGLVRDMGRWVGDKWEWTLSWRRDLLEREQRGVADLLELLRKFRRLGGLWICVVWVI